MGKRKKGSSHVGAIILIYIAFISLGLPDGLLGVAWPTMRGSFGVPLDALGLLLMTSTIGYLTSSFFSGVLMRKLGVGGLLAASSGITALALIGYTLVPVWWQVTALGILAGLGAGAIDAGLNAYVEANYGEGLMQWLHASFGIGVTLGPIIMTRGLNTFGSWRIGYLIVGTVQLLLAISFILTASLWRNRKNLKESNPGVETTAASPTLGQTLKYSSSWLSASLFFIYTGIELSLGHWTYTILTSSRGIAPQLAGFWAGSYWGTFTLGRILAGFLSCRVDSRKLVNGGLFLALIGTVLFWLGPTAGSALLGVVLTGFALAPIFPGMVSSTSYRVGVSHTANTIGMQIAAAGLGGALLPGLAGVLARQLSLEVIPLFLVVLVVLLLILERVPKYLMDRAQFTP